MEFFDVLDKEGKPTGAVLERGTELDGGTYRLVVDVFIKNKNREYLISRRSPDKFPDPGLWEPTCGSVLAGENSLDAALREVKEEMGLTLDPSRGRLVTRTTDGRCCFFDIWLFEQEFDINEVILQDGEIDAATWAGADAIRKLMREGKFLSPERLLYINDLLDGKYETKNFCAVCLITHNKNEMVEFYKKVFDAEPEIDGPDHRFAEARVIVFDIENFEPEAEGTRNAALIYLVTDADAEYKRLAALGVAYDAPTDKPWGSRSFSIKDPDGNSLNFAAPIK